MRGGGTTVAVAQLWPWHSRAGGTAATETTAQRWRWPSRAGCHEEQPFSFAHPGHSGSAPGGKCLGTGTDNGGGRRPDGEEGGAGPAQLDPGDVGEEEPEGFKTGPGVRPGCSQPT